MRDHRGIAGIPGHSNGCKCFRQGANLVELDQNRIGNLPLNSLRQDGGVGDEKVITDQLDTIAEAPGQAFPAIPIAFVHAILDRENGILLNEIGKVSSESICVVFLPFAAQKIATVSVEFRSGAIKRQSHVFADPVPGQIDRFQNGMDCRLVAGQVGRKATFIPHRCREPLLGQYLLQCVEHFCTAAKSLGKGCSSHWLDHEFLDVDVVVGVFAAVNDVHHRQGHRKLPCGAVKYSNVLIQRNASLGGRGLGGCEGYSQHRVGA